MRRWMLVLALSACGPSALVCSGSIDDGCADLPAGCPLTLDAARQQWCAGTSQILTERCGSWTVFELRGVDVATFYYYDSNGQLAVITGVGGALSSACWGPRSFAAPSCGPATPCM